jgi:GT2 family glycosyltransferase
VSTPIVTIAIPNWNHELLVPRAIESALQGVKRLAAAGILAEVLVLDDASRDGSRKILQALQFQEHHRGLRVLALKQNVGLSGARNLLLHHARSPYVLFMDADNELLAANLPLFVQAIQDTDATAVYGTLLIRSITSDLAIDGFSFAPFRNEIFIDNEIDAMALVNRERILESGGYQHQRLEDYELWLHLALNGHDVIHVPAIMGYYYMVPSSMTADPQLNENLVKIQGRIRRIYDQSQARQHLTIKTRMKQYHPTLGMIPPELET